MTDTITERIERFKVKAEIFFKNELDCFVIDIYNNYYFCKIINIDNDFLYIHNFKGKRNGEDDRLVWSDIIKLDEYREER